MVEKKGLKLLKKDVKLTDVEKEILHLITEEFLTIKQIAQRRKCSLQVVYKTVKKIKKKGVMGIGLNKVEKVESTFNQSDLRLHGQEFNIRILQQDNKYQEQINKSNILFLDGNTIRLYKNSIEIYSGQSFFGKDVNSVERKSLEYIRRFLTRLEHDLEVILIKPRARNIKIVNQHWARGDSEISENAIKNKERVWVYAEEDGKLCFISDDSFGFKEDETLHPITAKPDRKAIDKQINDWRLNNPLTNSEIAKNQEETGQNLKILVDAVSKQVEMYADFPKQIESHLKLIQEYRKENIAWRKEKVREIKKDLIYGKQTKLDNFLNKFSK